MYHCYEEFVVTSDGNLNVLVTFPVAALTTSSFFTVLILSVTDDKLDVSDSKNFVDALPFICQNCNFRLTIGSYKVSLLLFVSAFATLIVQHLSK